MNRKEELIDEIWQTKYSEKSVNQLVAFISQEKNLLLDQAIEELEKLKVPIDEMLPQDSVTVIGQLGHNQALSQAIDKLKELKE